MLSRHDESVLNHRKVIPCPAKSRQMIISAIAAMAIALSGCSKRGLSEPPDMTGRYFWPKPIKSLSVPISPQAHKQIQSNEFFKPQPIRFKEIKISRCRKDRYLCETITLVPGSDNTLAMATNKNYLWKQDNGYWPHSEVSYDQYLLGGLVAYKSLKDTEDAGPWSKFPEEYGRLSYREQEVITSILKTSIPLFPYKPGKRAGLEVLYMHTTDFRGKDSQHSWNAFSRVYLCTWGDAVKASMLDSNLTGNAFLLECKTSDKIINDDRSSGSSVPGEPWGRTYAYFEDLGIFLGTNDLAKSNFPEYKLEVIK